MSENTEFELKTTLIQNLCASAVDLAFLNRRNNHSEGMAYLTFSFTFSDQNFSQFGLGKENANRRYWLMSRIIGGWQTSVKGQTVHTLNSEALQSLTALLL